MHGMFDHQARVAFARDHVDRLQEVMRASRRRPRTEDEAGRRKPACLDAAKQPAPTPLRAHRGAF